MHSDGVEPQPSIRSWVLLGVLTVCAFLAWRATMGSERTYGEVAAADPAFPPVRHPSLRPVIWIVMAIAVGALGWTAGQAMMAASEADAVARAVTGGDPAKAAALVTRYGCAGCHTIPGLPGADGQVAAPLEELRKRVFIGGVLPNTADNLIDWIVQPQAYSPNTAMPATGVTKAEARDIAAYLYAH
jgi:cytochrome c